MLKYLLLILTITSALAGDPPVSIKGQYSTSKLLPKWNLQVPGNQATNLGGIDALLETGNKNLLKDPSFESALQNDGWSGNQVSATYSLTRTATGAPAEFGKKMAAVTCTIAASGSCEISQNVITSSQSQGLISVQVLGQATTSTAVVKVYRWIDGVKLTGSTDFVVVPNNAKWNLMRIPTSLGASQTGFSVEIAQTTAGAPVLNIDDAFLGPVDLKADTQSTTIESYTAVWAIASNGAVASITPLKSNVGTLITAPTFSGNEITMTVLKPGQLLINVGNRSTNNLASIAFSVNGVSRGNSYEVTTANSPSVGGGTFTERLVAGDVVKVITGNQSAVTDQPFSYSMTSGASNTTYSSTNADTDWQPCTIPNWQAFGVTSQAFQCKRDGGDLWMKGRLVMGTVVAAEWRLFLPLWNGVQLQSKGSSIYPTDQPLGVVTRNQGSAVNVYNSIMGPSLTYLRMSYYNEVATNPMVPRNASALFNNDETIFFSPFRVAIEGWENSNVTVAKLNGLESCTDSYQCTNDFSGEINANTFYEGGLSIISSCTGGAGGAGTCTFKNKPDGTPIFTVAPKMGCSMNGTESAGIRFCSIQSSATGFTWTTQYQTTAGAQGYNPYTFTYWAQKSPPDFNAKTAVAGAANLSVAKSELQYLMAIGGDVGKVVPAGAAAIAYVDFSSIVVNEGVTSYVTLTDSTTFTVGTQGGGLYEIAGSVQYNTTATGGYVRSEVYCAGTLTTAANFMGSSSNTQYTGINMAPIFCRLNAGQTIRVGMYQNGSGTVTIRGSQIAIKRVPQP